ncbi:MAG: IS1 family transposase [Actinomycetota bacterium]|nr:IS1 family transposase [Actinomycetota bacterium]
MISIKRLSTEKRARITECLVEGTSLQTTARMTAAARETVEKLLADLGSACSEYQDQVMRELPCRRVRVEEMWTFARTRKGHLPCDGHDEREDVWTWVALDADAKLVPAWLIGQRTSEDAIYFVQGLAARLAHRVQLTTDGRNAFLYGVDEAVGSGIDYARLIELYGATRGENEERHGMARSLGREVRRITGDPDPGHISAGHVERQSLTMRMGMRSMTRLSNALSTRVENLAATVSLHFMHYNFARLLDTLARPSSRTPAMAAGIADHVWSLDEIAGLLDSN